MTGSGTLLSVEMLSVPSEEGEDETRRQAGLACFGQSLEAKEAEASSLCSVALASQSAVAWEEQLLGPEGSQTYPGVLLLLLSGSCSYWDVS